MYVGKGVEVLPISNLSPYIPMVVLKCNVGFLRCTFFFYYGSVCIFSLVVRDYILVDFTFVRRCQSHCNDLASSLERVFA